MAEITADTSSYKLPTTSPFDVAKNIGGLQQQKLAIDQAKMDQSNQALTYLTRAMSAIGPNARPDQYLRAGQDAVNAGLVPPNMFHIWENKVKDYASRGDMPGMYNEFMTAAANHQFSQGVHVGVPTSVDTGQRTRFFQMPGGMGKSPTELGQVPTEIPPTALGRNSINEPQMMGNQPSPAAPGFRSRIAPPLPTGDMPVNQLPRGAFGPGEVPRSAQVQPPTSPGNAPATAAGPMPRGPVIGLAPGEQEAAGAAGKHLAEDRIRAQSFQRDVFPLAQAIPALETLGTKGTGPGTDTINQVKSFILSNVPGVKESDMASVRTFDEAKKYLTDFVNQTGNSGTNDKLAAAFAGNPSVGISNAAAIDVAKSALALRRMQHAIYSEFERQGLPAQQYSRWSALRGSDIDPRAFGLDMMNQEQLKALKGSFKSQREADQFQRSLDLSKGMGFLNPSKAQ